MRWGISRWAARLPRKGQFVTTHTDLCQRALRRLALSGMKLNFDALPIVRVRVFLDSSDDGLLNVLANGVRARNGAQSDRDACHLARASPVPNTLESSRKQG
jgi:hypothetical protein